MRTVVAWLVATVALLALLAPAGAAPPTDVDAYCRATYPHVPFQVRCVNVESAAAARVARAGAAIDRTAFAGCLEASPSWAAMESCLVRSASAEASAIAPAPDLRLDSAGGGQPGQDHGPRISPVAAPLQPTRPSLPIPEADAERHLRGILERLGTPSARCTKKQYGPGWVSICE